MDSIIAAFDLALAEAAAAAEVEGLLEEAAILKTKSKFYYFGNYKLHLSTLLTNLIELLPTLLAFELVGEMTFLAVDGEYLDRVLDLTVSQPSSSILLSFLDDNDDVVGVEETLFKSSTDRGVFKPLTVSAHDLLELDELIEDVEPKGNEQLLFEVGAASGSLGLVLEVTLEVVVRPLPGIDGMVTDLDKGRWLLTFELFCWTLAANRVCL